MRETVVPRYLMSTMEALPLAAIITTVVVFFLAVQQNAHAARRCRDSIRINRSTGLEGNIETVGRRAGFQILHRTVVSASS
jgi:hypothetical protein